MTQNKCCICNNASELRHEERKKDYCYKCWSRVCAKKVKDDDEEFKKASGVGLYKWVD